MTRKTEESAKRPVAGKPDEQKHKFRKSGADENEAVKLEELGPEELRVLADTMPGDGPGGD
jgi:hypothetical protein